MAARTDERFGKILRSADLNLPDGIGLVWWSRHLGQPIPERVAGADFAVDLCRLADDRRLPVFFLGGRPGVAARAAEAVRRLVPELRLAGAIDGGQPRPDESGRLRSDPTTLEAIRSSGAAVVLVAFDPKASCSRRSAEEVPVTS